MDSDVAVYATIEHEFKLKVRQGLVTGESAKIENYAKVQTNQTIEEIVRADVAWIRSEGWYAGREIALGEFAMRVVNGDATMAAFYSNAGDRLAGEGISWAVFFNREKDGGYRIADRSDGLPGWTSRRPQRGAEQVGASI